MSVVGAGFDADDRPTELLEVGAGEAGVGPGHRRPFVRDHDRPAFGERARNVLVLGHEHVRRPSQNRLGLVAADADLGRGAVEDQLDLVRLVAHELEGLEAELRVLERQRVEHADHAEM